MKADLKKQKLQQRESERRQRRRKMTIVAGLAILAGGFALTSFTPDVALSETPSPGGFRRITADELKPRFDRGEVTIIDVRDADQFVQSHIPGALQIPLARIEGEIAYLPKGKPIVTYCTCPAEESSGLAVEILRNAGVGGAAALHGGLAAWRKAGYPVESGPPRR